jgi:hypothetical protein
MFQTSAIVCLAFVLAELAAAGACGGGPDHRFPQHGPVSHGLTLAAGLSSSHAISSDPIDLCVDLAARGRTPIRLWTSGAAADYEIDVVDVRTSTHLAPQASWHVVIGRVGSVTLAPGHDAVDCLPLTRIFDLTHAGTYDVVAMRSRPRPYDASDGTVTWPPVVSNHVTLTILPRT